MRHKAASFLIIEDNELDAEKIVRSMRRLNMTNTTTRVKDGEAALDVLRGTNGQSILLEPYIILLDINMPRMNGVEFLKAIRADSNIGHAPVFVLTTSDRQQDIDAAYSYNVCGYVVKPVKLEQMDAALSALNAYWNLTELPLSSARS